MGYEALIRMYAYKLIIDVMLVSSFQCFKPFVNLSSLRKVFNAMGHAAHRPSCQVGCSGGHGSFRCDARCNATPIASGESNTSKPRPSHQLITMTLCEFFSKFYFVSLDPRTIFLSSPYPPTSS